MGKTLNRTDLAPPRQRLLTLMQELDFGEILGLTVHRGQPVFSPFPCVVRKIKLRCDDSPRRELKLRDFRLRKEVIRLLDCMSHLRDGVIRRIEVKHGLPFSMDIDQDAGC